MSGSEASDGDGLPALIALESLPSHHVCPDIILAYIRYWQGLRRDRTIPSLRDLFDSPDWKIQPSLVIIDIERETDQRIRLAGTAIDSFFGGDFTGLDFLKTATEDTRQIFVRAHQVLSRVPCGKLHFSMCSTTTGREIEVCALALPFTRGNGLPCAAWLLVLGDTLNFGELGAEIRSISAEYWIAV